MVVRTEASKAQIGTRKLEAFPESVPFVAEVWSPSTGSYDIETKIPEYRARGDAVVWRIHPYDQIVTAWERQQDGSYTETTYRSGTIVIPSLPGVSVALDEIFD
jgi:Uma2 family endonuclease